MTTLRETAAAAPEDPRRLGPTPSVQPALAAELEAGHWEFPWHLAPGLTAPVADPGARHAASTLEAMLEHPVRDGLAVGGEGRTALDLACGEGRLAHRLLAWNATRVLGIELEGPRLRRAELLQHHFVLPASALELRGASDLQELDAAALGAFDVVLITGSPDRVKGTGSLIRLARACTRALCVIESASPDLEPLASEIRHAGFFEITRLAPPPDAERRYVLGERAVLTAEVEPER